MPHLASDSRGAPHSLALAKALSPVAALLAISTFINYIDRGSLSLAVPLLKTELQLSPWQLGILLSSFFWTYTSFQIVSGWLVDRFNVCWVYAIGFFVWSGATAATGMAKVFGVIFGLRLLLGMGESVAYPSYSRILANNFPEHHRGFANALIDAGTKVLVVPADEEENTRFTGAVVLDVQPQGEAPPNSTIVIDEERARSWLARGAQPSDTVRKLMRIQGIHS